MKKSIILSFVFLLTVVTQRSFGMTNIPLPRDTQPVTMLVINADVTVVLVNNPGATLQVTGSDAFKKNIRVRQSGKSITISASRNRDFRESGIIYIPASGLSSIKINSSAFVKTVLPLTASVLDVVFNGTCKIAISNIGKINLVETDAYTFEKKVELYRIPESTITDKKD